MKLTIIGRSFPGRTLLLVLVSLAAGYGLRGACAPATTGGGMATHGDHAPAPSTTWSCSMHPQVHSPDPGACPTCGMDLVEVSADQQGTGERQIVLDPAAVALAEIATTRVERRFPTAVLRMAGSLTYDETRLDSPAAARRRSSIPSTGTSSRATSRRFSRAPSLLTSGASRGAATGSWPSARPRGATCCAWGSSRASGSRSCPRGST